MFVGSLFVFCCLACWNVLRDDECISYKCVNVFALHMRLLSKVCQFNVGVHGFIVRWLDSAARFIKRVSNKCFGSHPIRES